LNCRDKIILSPTQRDKTVLSPGQIFVPGTRLAPYLDRYLQFLRCLGNDKFGHEKKSCTQVKNHTTVDTKPPAAAEQQLWRQAAWGRWRQLGGCAVAASLAAAVAALWQHGVGSGGSAAVVAAAAARWRWRWQGRRRRQSGGSRAAVVAAAAAADHFIFGI
jgi:hypothetical protein